MGKWGEPTTPPPGAAAAHFQYHRVPRDRAWGILFAAAWVAAIVGGIYAITHRNPAFLHIDYNDPASCPYHPNDAHRRLLEGVAEKAKGDWSLGDFMHVAGRWLAVSAAAALLLGVAFIQLFKHHPATMTRVTIWTQIAFPAALAMASLLSGQLLGSAMFGVMAGLAALVFYMWRGEIGLATRLLGVSAHGLVANGGIILATVLLNLASIVAIVPLCVFLGFAFMNGHVVPNPSRDPSATECVDGEGQAVLCCTWEPNPYGKAYLAFGSVVVLWTMLLANQIRVFVTSGAIAQWYFAPADALSAPRGTTLRSVRHALGPNFGSLSFASLVLTIAEMLRSALENSQNENNREFNLLVVFRVCLVCIAQLFLGALEYLTKFATVMCAITGESFLSAGRHVTDLLFRNFLQAFASTVWFTPLVIRMACFLLAAGWGAASGAAYYAMHRGSELEAQPGVNAAVLGVSVFVVTQFVLSFLGGILLSVLDAVFICWAIDKDCQTVSHPEVFAVFEAVPIPGAVVEQPGGEVLYGAGQAPPQPAGTHQYEPPHVARV